MSTLMFHLSHHPVLCVWVIIVVFLGIALMLINKEDDDPNFK